MGTASAMYPSAAGTMTTIVSRTPREKSVRSPSMSRSAHRPDIGGRSAVKIDTATIACGSWKRMNALA